MRADLSDIDIPNINLYPSTTNYYEHKRCFKLCVKDMQSPYFTDQEQTCSTNCLSKYIQAQIFVSQKMTHQLTQLITQDPKIKMAFKRPQNFQQKQMFQSNDDYDEE